MALNRNLVVLVDSRDQETGTAEKLRAHQDGLLHRALSVFIVNNNDEMLLQRRAASKYHSGGLWSNACCSHPCPGETTADAAVRRLREELGIETPLRPAGTWYYRAGVGAGLIEHEFDHLFTGTWTGTPAPDPAEVSDTAWVPLRDLYHLVREHPDDYTAWFPQILDAWTAARNQASSE